MNENIKKFLEKVSADKEIQAKFAKIRDPEEAYKLAASVQDGFTKEEFLTEMKKLYEESMQDLSEDDMAKVAGGIALPPKMQQSLILGTATIGATMIAAMAATP